MADLADLLNQVRSDYDISAETISSQILGSSRQRLVEQLATNGFSLGEIISADTKVFATENPRFLFVEFQIDYRCPNLANSAQPSATLTVKGDGSYDAERQAFGEHRNTAGRKVNTIGCQNWRPI